MQKTSDFKCPIFIYFMAFITVVSILLGPGSTASHNSYNLAIITFHARISFLIFQKLLNYHLIMFQHSFPTRSGVFSTSDAVALFSIIIIIIIIPLQIGPNVIQWYLIASIHLLCNGSVTQS